MLPGIFEAEGLGRSARRVGPGVKVKKNLPPPEIRKRYLFFILIGQSKIRRLVLGFELHTFSPSMTYCYMYRVKESRALVNENSFLTNLS